MQQTKFDRTIAIIINLEPDFDVVEEQIVEHVRLRFEGLVIVHQLDWWLTELRELQSQLPMGYGSIDHLREEAHRRVKAERGRLDNSIESTGGNLSCVSDQ